MKIISAPIASEKLEHVPRSSDEPDGAATVMPDLQWKELMSRMATPKNNGSAGQAEKWKDQEEIPVITDVLSSSPRSANVTLPELNATLNNESVKPALLSPQSEILLETRREVDAIQSPTIEFAASIDFGPRSHGNINARSKPFPTCS